MDKSDQLADAFVGSLGGLFIGAIAGGALVWGVSACVQWLTHYTWSEYWGDFAALLYGVPAGAAVGMIVGAVLGYRGVTFRK